MAEKAAAAAPAVSVGETVSGTVEHVAPYGAFVRLESGQKAMVHISELSHNYVKKVEDVLEQGKNITAKVIKIDDKGRIDLSIKALQVREVRPPVHREFSDEKIADLNSKCKDPRGTKRRAGGSGTAGKK